MTDAVNNPSHYGGKDNVYETIKVIRAWGLNFSLGNTVKYICRAGKKIPDGIDVIGNRHIQQRARLQDLKKARWYIDEEISVLEQEMSAGQQALSEASNKV